MTTYRTFRSTLTELGTLTDDGRMLAADMALSFRSFPMALGWQPRDVIGHEEAITVGVIENAVLNGNKVEATGYFLNTPEADQAVEQIAHGVSRPSVDLGAATAVLTDEAGNPIDMEAWFNGDAEFDPNMKVVETLTEAKVLGATLVRIAAFDRPTDIQMTGTVERDDALVASVIAALAPVTAAGERKFADDFTPRRALFEDPKLDGFTHPTYDEKTGRVYGHIAPWGKQHIGFAGHSKKVQAPRSESGYAYFHTSRVQTDAGPLMVGKLTVATGHAGLRDASKDAASHYDHTGTCWAYVCAGEDAHGIWFSGVLHPTATDDQVRDGLASPLSGDWRPIAPGQLELVAALSVNTPGFPLVASATDDAGELLALVAALAPRKTNTIAQGGIVAAPTPPNTDAKPAAPNAPASPPAEDGKFPKGSKVTIKGDNNADPAEVTDYQTNVNVYRVNDQWYLEDELAAADTPADGATPPPVQASAAAIARELHALQRRDQETRTLLSKVSQVRMARAKNIITKAGR